MRGKWLGLCAAACVVAGMCGASSAHATQLSGYDLRPGIPALYYNTAEGEDSDIRITAKPNPSTTWPGEFEPKVVTFEDRAATLTTGGQYPCELLSSHKARCTLAGSWWFRIELWLYDGKDRVRAVGAGLPGLRIHAWGDGGNRFTVSGGSIEGAGTGDRVRFRPPGGGSVLAGGRPFIWLADGAAEEVYCQGGPTNPIIVSDPLDTFDRTWC